MFNVSIMAAAKQRVSRLYGANMGAERVVFVVNCLSNYLMRVDVLHTVP